MKAHELLSDGSKWCQGALALDALDRVVDAGSPTACRWCLWGALMVAYESESSKFTAVMYAIKDRVGPPDLYNDAEHRTFEEVRSLLIELDV